MTIIRYRYDITGQKAGIDWEYYLITLPTQVIIIGLCALGAIKLVEIIR